MLGDIFATSCTLKVVVLNFGFPFFQSIYLILSGTMCESVVVPGCLVEKMPSNVNWEGAATVPYSALMVWNALVWQGGLR